MPVQSKRKPRIRKRSAQFLLAVKRSRIHRYGVFAGETIPSRQVVIEYAGERIGLTEARRRYGVPPDSKRWKPTYLFRLGPRRVIDGARGGSGAEIINHSCDPNLRARIRRGRIWLWSRRRILPGEELTMDYKFSKKLPKTPCHCGSLLCRGVMNKK